MAAGLASLKGPRHGGANIKVTKMLDNIRENVKEKGDKKEIRDYLKKILDKKSFDDEGLIYGLAHAVYTLSDPRAVLLKEKARELAKIKGREADFAFVENIEKMGPELIMKKFNKSYPPCANVDLYSGLVYDMLKIPREVFLPIFAIAITVGWSAYRLDQIADKKIMRPAYKYLGERKEYIDLDHR